MIHDLLYSLVLLFALAVVGWTLLYERRTKICAMPVMPWVMRAAFGLLAAHDPDRARACKIADLGCGWGGPMMRLAGCYPHAQVTGYELSLWPYLVSKFRAMFCARVRVARADFLATDLCEYDILFCYLSPWHMEALKPQFARLRKGTRIVSCAFEITGRTPVATAHVPGPVRTPVFLYVV